MKSTNQPGSGPKQNAPGSKPEKTSVSQPKKPNNDPDQTPNREVHNVPKAKPGFQSPGKNK